MNGFRTLCRVMAVWRRTLTGEVVIHSYQGVLFSSNDLPAFRKDHGLTASMSLCGHCYNNTAAESFLQLLQRKRIIRSIHLTREEMRSDIFNYIEKFYNSKRRHGNANAVSPVKFDQQFFDRLNCV